MENGPARPYRQFINSFQETVDLRRLMLDEFSRKDDLLLIIKTTYYEIA
jgi:hypothetical protein